MKLHYDARAVADLSEIYNYIAEHDSFAASRVIARIRALSEQLLEHPFLGRPTDQPKIRVRSVPRYPYLVFYTLKSDEIVILHIRHTARKSPSPNEVG